MTTKQGTDTVARRAVVATGMGTANPLGHGAETFWRGLLAGRSGITRPEDRVLASLTETIGVVPDVDAEVERRFPAHRKLLRDSGRFTVLALLAVAGALRESGLVDGAGDLVEGLDRTRVGIFMGNSFGDVGAMTDQAFHLAQHPDSHVGPRILSRSLPNAAAGTVAIRYGIRGPVLTYVTACASSANAMGEAREWLRQGRIDVAIAGGTECLLARVPMGSLHEAHAVAHAIEGEISTWSRPFDRTRHGMVPSEGAAVVVLEREHDARARGARIWGELLGYGTTSDAYNTIAPDPEAVGAALTMRRALEDADVLPEDIDYVNAHGTSTKAGDAAESVALRAVFGPGLEEIPVSSVKGHIGHVMGASGTLDSIACLYSLAEGRLPMNLNTTDPDEGMPPNLVLGSPAVQRVRIALSPSFGFGGQDAAVVWRACP